MSNKEFDQIFKSSLSNLEATPNKKVWENIASDLQKKKKRVIPIWWLSGAAAAVLILSFFIMNPLDDQKELKMIQDHEITNSNSIEKIQEDKVDKKIEFKENKITDEKIEIATTKIEEPKKDNPQLKTANAQFIERSITDMKRLKVYALDMNQHHLDTDFGKSNMIPSFPNKINNNISKLNLNTVVAKSAEQNEEEESNNRRSWSVAPVIGVMSSNSFTQASPISEDLASGISGESNTNFGIQVAYQINDKWTIQSGVQRLRMGYANSGIAVYNAPENTRGAVSMDNMTPSFYSGNFTTVSEASVNSLSDMLSTNTNLSQNIGYVEIPLEVKYNFLNFKKISTHLVTGFSTLFLDENEIVMSSPDATHSGEFTQLNTLNFSGNFGLDFNYWIDQKWSFHLNPMLKVQLNTFNDTHNFSPFNMGVYSGIRYRF